MPSPSTLSRALALAVLLLCSLVSESVAQTGDCISESQPNPIAQQYPDLPTGTINATMLVIPIPLKTARRIIPPQWNILEGAIRAVLPDFPCGMYPVILQAAKDHDVQLAAIGYHVPDFSRIGFEFPFLDLLGDGYTSFRWVPVQLISGDNAIAVTGSAAYGTVVYPATFDPPCDAYRGLPGGGGSAFSGRSSSNGSDDVFVKTEFQPLGAGQTGPYPVEFFKNVTNQPTFGNGSSCDSQVRLFNTSLTAAPYEPVAVSGSVFGNLAPLEGFEGGGEVFGVQLDTAFIESNYLDCKTLQGYSGTGPGD